MPVKIFKPNPRSTGALFNFNFGPAKKGGDLKGDLALYVSAVQQASWNDANKTGSFKENAKNPQKTIRVKMSEFEIGNFINSIKRRTEFKGYHSHDGRAGHVQFSFSPSKTDAGDFRGFLFSILRDGKEKFMVPITAGEAENLLVFLDFGLKTLYANRFKTQFSGEGSAAPAQRQQEAAPEPAAEQEGDPFAETPAKPEAAEETAEEQPEANPFG